MVVREFIRHPIAVPLDIEVADGGVSAQACQDISVGGLCFHSHVALRRGTKVALGIHIHEPAFTVEAVVKWCRQAGAEYMVGVQFASEKIAYTVRLIEQVCHVREYQLHLQATEGRVLTDEEAAREWVRRYAHLFPVSPMAVN